ncbi:multicopper oxidase family protein [Fibrella forsythiae]|uniref:Multicopper oxidase domain-containing protein n=1 Tax=Fibrella forsythiae TaxID=2817061 RepID=A0ABS3JQT5_9BACT|nr:multicopper oxidase domain-containing protein [Fibrella forsythiae]MBO0952357.1 multicopper oxidase domain-containing protein [Fibrella forsythiae]
MTKASILALSVAFALMIGCSKSSDTTVTPDGTSSATTVSGTYNDLWIPPTITGTTFNLTLAKTTKQMRTGSVTNTYSYNSTGFWGPTLIMNKGDFVKMNVTNNLPEATTTHWHGFHIPAIMDGGPHQMIDAGTTWTPSFEIRNNAGTYWYHPHLHEKTKEQLTYGTGGLIIIKDPVESALALPRTYGEDDIPLILTSRSYGTSNAFDLSARAYGDYQLTNGTSNAQISLPKQFVRLRILNAEIERGYNLGFSDNRTFYVITNDGGLLDAPVPVTRVKMMVGERVEILVNLGADAVGSSLDLKAYNSGQAFGFPGGESNSSGDFGSLLNNKDFPVLHINVKAATASAITALPAKLTTNTYWTNTDVTNSRTITITGGQGATAFSFDNNLYGDTKINQTVKLNAVEKWTITNNNIFGHSFHIHDIQFKIISRSSGTVGTHESGWKDTVYVPVGESVSVIAKFDDFASSTNAFMYHCHFSNHEDGGMMGQFLVTQ